MDEQLYLMAVGLSLDEKIEKAIANFQHYEHEAIKRDPENGYYLCDSFGKDSCVILHLAQKSGVKFSSHHGLTTLDAPELIQFGKRNHPDTIIHKPEMPMLKMLENKKGPPTRLMRWCCEKYKENGGNGSVKVLGVRAAESPRRKSNWRILTSHRKTESFLLNPILFWSDEDVWRYIHDNKVPYCGLYDEGFKRLGCVGCPMAGDGRKKEFLRWPRIGAAWKRAIVRFYDKWHDVPLQRPRTLPNGKITRQRWFDLKENINSGEDLFDWWMEDLPEAEDEGCQMGLF